MGSNVSPKYTDGGIIYTDIRQTTHKGWKDAGMQRFNNLCVFVREDRRSNPDMIPVLVQKWNTSRCKRKQSEVVLDIPGTEAYHELWDNEPLITAVVPATPNQTSRVIVDTSPVNNTAV